MAKNFVPANELKKAMVAGEKAYRNRVSVHDCPARFGHEGALREHWTLGFLCSMLAKVEQVRTRAKRQ